MILTIIRRVLHNPMMTGLSISLNQHLHLAADDIVDLRHLSHMKYS
jgi:hypothetical protein